MIAGLAPALVLAVEPDFAIVEVGGRRRRASTQSPDELHPGDWVLIAGGAVVRRVGSAQASLMARELRPTETEGAVEAHREAGHHYPTEQQEDDQPMPPGRPWGSSRP